MNLRSMNLWLSLVAAVLLITGAARAATQAKPVPLAPPQRGSSIAAEDGTSLEASEINSSTPYKGMLAQADDSGSGISGASDAGAAPTEDAVPKEDPKPKRKKRSKSWWPFGHNDRDSGARDRKKNVKKDEAGADAQPVEPKAEGTDPTPATGADAAPVDEHKDGAETLRPAKEGGDAATTPADDKGASEARLRQLQETLPAEITERARRGESRIADLLSKAQAIKSRQSERDKEAQEEARREEQRAIEHAREARRLRALVASGQLPEAEAAAPDEGPELEVRGNAGKIAALRQRKEALIAEGAPQDRLDRLDAQIVLLKRKDKEPKPKAPKEKTEVAKKPKSKTSKAAKTGKTAPAKPKKEKAAKAKAAAGDDLTAPPLPMDSAPEPAPAGPGEEAAPPVGPKKKKKAPAPDAGTGIDAPAVPAAGEEFKLDAPATNPNPGL